MKTYYILSLLALGGSMLSCQNDPSLEISQSSVQQIEPGDSLDQLYQIENTEVKSIVSSINKKEYELFIKLPRSYKEDLNHLFPVLILTDADYAFPLVSSISDRLFHTDLVEEFIVVGVSFSKGDERGLSKTRDYTPTFSPNEEQGFSKEAKMASGHANKFAKFLAIDVVNYLADHYRIDASHKALAGHSFGGLFTSYVAISQPEYFEYYLSGSPSLWYHDLVMFDLEKEIATKNNDLKTNLFMAIGDRENSANFHPMITQMHNFEKQLKSHNYPNLGIQSVVIPGEGHYTVYPSFITKGIIWAFGKNK